MNIEAILWIVHSRMYRDSKGHHKYNRATCPWELITALDDEQPDRPGDLEAQPDFHQCRVIFHPSDWLTAVEMFEYPYYLAALLTPLA